MEVIFTFKNLSSAEEREFSAYMDKKIGIIKNLLKKHSPDAILLKISCEKFDKHTAYNVEFNLSVPLSNIRSTECSHSIQKAIELSKDRLVTQIKKYSSNFRKNRKQRTIRKPKEKIEAFAF